MNPKEKRDRLFKGGRPFIRPIRLYDGENYGQDIRILWVAHSKQPFTWLDKNLSQEQFAKRIEEISSNEELLVAEDKSRKFKNGAGMVGLFSLTSDGWKYEPHFQLMPWASKRNILKTVVAFLQYIRYSKKVGACVVFSLENSISLFDKCCEYGVLFKVGKIVNGDPRGDEYIYSISGKAVKRKHVTQLRQEEIVQSV